MSLPLHPRKIADSIIEMVSQGLASWVLLGWSLWTLPPALCSGHQAAAANLAKLCSPTLALRALHPQRVPPVIASPAVHRTAQARLWLRTGLH